MNAEEFVNSLALEHNAKLTKNKDGSYTINGTKKKEGNCIITLADPGILRETDIELADRYVNPSSK